MSAKQEQTAIEVVNVSKRFKLPHERQGSIKSALINFRKRGGFEIQTALEDISFEVKKGEFFGIVGRNGSGKSTLLKLLAGIYSPTSGSINVTGKLTPFIELGVGFNPELTGRENVFLNGALLGFNRKVMTGMYKDIVKFAELDRFMDQKLKNYSSGMQVRLAFSIAIKVRSDILILDEVLAVGDAAFQRKCFDYFLDLKKNKQTVVLVTHDMAAIRQYCDRAIMIENGNIVAEGSPDRVAQAYQKLFVDEMKAERTLNRKEARPKHEAEDRWGEGGLVAKRPEVEVLKDTIKISAEYKATAEIDPPVYGFTIFDSIGDNVAEGNTLRERYQTKAVKPGETIEITWELPNLFLTGSYSISIACCDQSATHFYDWFNNAAAFDIFKEGATAGQVDPVIKISNYKVRA